VAAASIGAVAVATAPGAGAAGNGAATAPAASSPHTATVMVDVPPSSSSLAQQNLSVAQGAAVAVSELDAQHAPLHITLVAGHLDGLSPAAAAATVRSAHANALVLPCDTNSEYQLAAAIAKLDVLALAPCSYDPARGLHDANYWATGIPANAEAAGLAAWMGKRGYTRVLIVNAPGLSYASQITRYFRLAAPAERVEIIGSTTITPDAKGYAALVRHINAEPHRKRPPELFTALPPPYVNELVGALQKGLTTGLGITVTRVFGTAVMDTRLTLSTKPVPNGAYFSSYGLLQQAPAAQRFAADYRRLFGKPVVGGFAGAGFDTIGFFEAAVAKANSLSAAQIDRALSGGLTVSSVQNGTISYPAGGDHSPLADMAVQSVYAGTLNPLSVVVPSNVPSP
jgi:ABC-type branched-subunit amino acid transport system substrate-binding protein